jgi:hypothetical protein
VTNIPHLLTRPFVVIHSLFLVSHNDHLMACDYVSEEVSFSGVGEWCVRVCNFY